MTPRCSGGCSGGTSCRRSRCWCSPIKSQNWFGYSIDRAWVAWVAPLFGTVIYLWGGRPLLAGGVPKPATGSQG